MNALIPSVSGLPTAADLANQFSRNALAAGHAAVNGSGKQYLKFDGNTGSLTWGRAGAALPPDQRLIVMVGEITHGWIYWSGGKSEQATEVHVPGWEPFPAKPDNRGLVGSMAKPYDRDGWQPTFTLSFTGLGGILDRTPAELPGSSRGMQQLWTGVIAAAVQRMQSGDSHVFPIITIGADSYQHETYRRTVFVPKFDIVGWTDGAEIVPHVVGQVAAAPAADPEVDVLS